MTKKVTTPPMDDEAMEMKLVALSMKQAEEQLQAGTASSQIVTHFLKLGSTRAMIELKKLELENLLLTEKIEAEKIGQQLQVEFKQVLAALKSYSYEPPTEESWDDPDLF